MITRLLIGILVRNGFTDGAGKKQSVERLESCCIPNTPSLYLKLPPCFLDGHWEGELLQTKSDGTCIAVASRWSVWRDPEGAPQGWLEINTDISERKQAEQELRELSVRLLQAQDEERRRLARELHDSSGQTLVALKLNLNTICNGATVLVPEAALAISQSTALIDCLSKELRTMSYLLHPPLLDEVGLASALHCYIEGLAERSSIKATL